MDLVPILQKEIQLIMPSISFGATAAHLPDLVLRDLKRVPQGKSRFYSQPHHIRF